MLSLVTEGPQHASSTQEAPPLGRCRFDCDRFFAADTRTCADVPDRLRDPPVPVWRLACFRPLRPSTRRIYPADYTLAGRTTAANLALSHGRLLRERSVTKLRWPHL